MITEILMRNYGLNKTVAKMAIFPVRLQIKSQLNFDVLGRNKPGVKSELIQKPALFMIGE